MGDKVTWHNFFIWVDLDKWPTYSTPLIGLEKPGWHGAWIFVGALVYKEAQDSFESVFSLDLEEERPVLVSVKVEWNSVLDSTFSNIRKDYQGNIEEVLLEYLGGYCEVFQTEYCGY